MSGGINCSDGTASFFSAWVFANEHHHLHHHWPLWLSSETIGISLAPEVAVTMATVVGCQVGT